MSGFFYACNFLLSFESEQKKADPLAGFSYHKQDQPIKQNWLKKHSYSHS